MSILSSDRCIQEAAWFSVAPPFLAVGTRRMEAEKGGWGGMVCRGLWMLYSLSQPPEGRETVLRKGRERECSEVQVRLRCRSLRC